MTAKTFCPHCLKITENHFLKKKNKFLCLECEEEILIDNTKIKTEISQKRKIFLSYGHDENSEDLVFQIKSDLEARGLEVWLDKNRIEFGDDWRREITDGIKSSSHVLAFLSQYSTRKPGVCRQEIAIALGPLKGHVFTILVEPLHKVSPPLIISHLQWLDMQNWKHLKDHQPDQYRQLYQKSLSKILEVIEINRSFAGEISELRSWLNPIDCTTDMIKAEDGFTGRQWLLGCVGETSIGAPINENYDLVGEIEKWRTSSDNSQVLWLSAEPGWGKSAIAARLAHAGRSRVLAVHFCRQDMEERKNARKIICSIAFQIATQLSEYRSLLIELLNKDPQIDTKSAHEIFDYLLSNPLNYVINGERTAQDKHIIVIDGIDETIDNNGYSELLSLISSEFSNLPQWIGLVVTSRPEAPVMRQLGYFGVTELVASDTRNLLDLDAYISNWLLEILPAKDIPQAKNNILEMSSGNFLYLRQLEASIKSKVIQPSNLINSRLLPKGLSALYERWFRHRFNNKSHYEAFQKPLLELIISAREPLSISLIQCFLKWDHYQLAISVETLGSLCNINEQDENPTIRLYHKSLRDWLINPKVSGKNWFISEAEGQRRIALGLWEIYQKWSKESKSFEDDIGYMSLGVPGKFYALKHTAEHLKIANLSEQYEAFLLDFRLALKRCCQEILPNFINDYENLRASNNYKLQAWADCIGTRGYQLRRTTPHWETYKSFYQLAIEHANNSPITISAQNWMQLSKPDWLWISKQEKDATFKPSRQLNVFEGHKAEVTDVKLIDINHILSLSNDGTLRIWDIDNGLCEQVIRIGISSKYVSPEILKWTENLIVCWSNLNKELCVFDLKNNNNMSILEFHSEDIIGTKILPDGRLLSWGQDGALSVWCYNELNQYKAMPGHIGNIKDPLIAPNQYIITWAGQSRDRGKDTTVRIWDIETYDLIKEIYCDEQINGVCLSKENDKLIIWSKSNFIDIINLKNLNSISKLNMDFIGINGVQCLDNSYACAWTANDIIHIINLNTLTITANLIGHSEKINGIVELTQGRILSYSRDGSSRVWDKGNGKCIYIFLGHTHWIMQSETIGENLVYTRSLDKTIRLWDLRSGNCVITLDADKLSILDQNRLAFWSSNTATIHIIDDINTLNLAPLSGHSKPINGILCYSKNNAITWSQDGSIRSWNISASSFNDHVVTARQLVKVHQIDQLAYVVEYNDCSMDLLVKNLYPKILIGHNKRIKKIIKLLNDKFLSISEDITMRIWDQHNANEYITLSGHEDVIFDALEVYEGVILSWSADLTLRIWNASNGKCEHILRGHERSVEKVLIGDAGKFISFSQDNKIIFWDTFTGMIDKIIKDIPNIFELVSIKNKFLIFSNEACFVYSNYDDKIIKILSNPPRDIFKVSENQVIVCGNSLRFNPDNNKKKHGFACYLINISDLNTEVTTFNEIAGTDGEIHTEWDEWIINAFQFTDDIYVIYYTSGLITLWDLKNKILLKQIQANCGSIDNYNIIHKTGEASILIIYFSNGSFLKITSDIKIDDIIPSSSWLEKINQYEMAEELVSVVGGLSTDYFKIIGLNGQIYLISNDTNTPIIWHGNDPHLYPLFISNHSIIVCDGNEIRSLNLYAGEKIIPL